MLKKWYPFSNLEGATRPNTKKACPCGGLFLRKNRCVEDCNKLTKKFDVSKSEITRLRYRFEKNEAVN